LYRRLLRWRRDQDPGDEWPPLDPTFVAAQQRERDAAAIAARQQAESQVAARERAQRAAVSEADEARRGELETRFGEQARALTPQEREQLGREFAGDRWNFVRGIESLAHRTLVDALAAAALVHDTEVRA
jgi:hypothetical protein